MVGEMKRRYGATILNYGARDEETILWWARWGKTRFARFPQAFYTLDLHQHARIVVPH